MRAATVAPRRQPARSYDKIPLANNGPHSARNVPRVAANHGRLCTHRKTTE
jgi:hypothetical protein